MQFDKKQLITIAERLAIILIIITLAIIMRWSSDRIKQRREGYLDAGRQGVRASIRLDKKEGPGLATEKQAADAEYHFEKGLSAARTGRLSEAVACLEKAIEMDPRHYRALSNLGLVYKNMFLINRDEAILDKAFDYYHKAIEINPDFSDVYNNLGDAYFNMEKYTEAEEAFRKAIELDPTNINALNNLGTALIMQNKQGEAVVYWRRSIEINPRQPQILEYLSRNE